MFKGHPWEGEDFGRMEYEWYLARGYEVMVNFDVNFEQFIKFCKTIGQRANQLTMKITARLSTEHLPQYMIALNGKPYPTRYPSGYVRPIEAGRDMLEHIAIREKNADFSERNIREGFPSGVKWMAKHQPKLSVFLAKNIFASREVKNNYALMVTRNPLRGLNTKVMFSGTHLRTMALAIPFGKEATCTFAYPHAFGNINCYEPFLKLFKTYMENPEEIPQDILEKRYKVI
jgi:hypothetical protein